MKNIYKYMMMSVVGAIGFSSCSFLETSSPSDFTSDIVFNDGALTEKALMGVYAKFTEDATYSQNMAITFNCGSDIEIRSFTLDQPAGSTDRAAANFLATATNDKITKATESLYDAIERANVLIQGIEEGSSYRAGVAEFKKMHGEAIVLRAQCYRDLVRMLGNVPFKIEPTKTDLSNVYLPKTDRFQIMEVLIDQLQTYAEELPWLQDTPERVTRGYAYGLLAQIALMRAGWNYSTDCNWEAPRLDAGTYYQIASDACQQVISSGQYNLVNKFEDFFYDACQRL